MTVDVLLLRDPFPSEVLQMESRDSSLVGRIGKWEIHVGRNPVFDNPPFVAIAMTDELSHLEPLLAASTGLYAGKPSVYVELAGIFNGAMLVIDEELF